MMRRLVAFVSSPEVIRNIMRSQICMQQKILMIKYF